MAKRSEMGMNADEQKMNPWLVGIAGSYYPWPEFAPDVDEYVHVLSRAVTESDPLRRSGDPVEQRPAELRLSSDGEWLNAVDRSVWRDGDGERVVLAWMPRGGDRVAHYREKFGGSYRDIIRDRAAS